VVDQLVLLAGRGDQAAPADTNAPIVTAQAFVAPLINNLDLAIPAAQADPDYANLSPMRQGHVANVATSITAWKALPTDPPAPAAQPKAAAQTAIGNACVIAVRPGVANAANLTAIRAANPGAVQFDQGGDVVPGPAATALLGLGTVLSAKPEPKVNVGVVGHASSEGTEPSNQDLSQKRADNAAAAIKAANADVATKHNVVVSAVGEAGAAATPDWRRSDISIDAVETTNNLHDGARSAPVRAMMDLMLDLRNIGTDASSGQRNIYGGHSYSVVGVSFVNTAGAPVGLGGVTGAARVAMFPQVDTTQSWVRLRNPHHGNEPDRLGNNTPTNPGDGPPSSRASDGIFTMSLEEFFRNFNAVDTGVFPRS
jgi:outer membrane protein OmpA-like peptidoglycan-associated protein